MDTIYCIKTGQPIGTLLCATEYHPSAVAPDWRSTDGSNLDKLQEHEPRAYVAFCLGLIDRFWRSRQHRGDAKGAWTTREDASEHHWSLVRAYSLLGNIPEESLSELANALWRFVAYSPRSYRILDAHFLPGRRAADLLAETAQAGKLIAILDKSYVETIASVLYSASAGASVKTAKFELKAKTFADAIKGPSNITSQSKTREYNKNAKQNKLMADIAALYDDALGIKKAKSQASALMSRLSRQSASLDRDTITYKVYSEASDKEQDLLEALDSIMQGGNFSSDMELDDDDIVEVRAIPHALVESLSQPTAVPPLRELEPVKRMTLAERIARNTKKD